MTTATEQPGVRRLNGESATGPARGDIYRLIPQVMRTVGAVEKGRRNEQQGYRFRGIDDLYNAMQQPMADAGIFCVPYVLERHREERQTQKGGTLFYTTLTVRHTFYAPDGSSVDCVTIGEAMDSGDKSSNKAMSAAMKYALIEVFCIPTADAKDTDDDSPRVKPRHAPPPQRDPFIDTFTNAVKGRGFGDERAGAFLMHFLEQKGLSLEQLDKQARQKLLERVEDGTYDAWLRPPPAKRDTEQGAGGAEPTSPPAGESPATPAAPDAPPVDPVTEALEQDEYLMTLSNLLQEKLGIGADLAHRAIQGWVRLNAPGGEPKSMPMDKRRQVYDAIKGGTAHVSKTGVLRY